MSSLLGNIRFYILIFSVSLAISIYLYVQVTIPNQTSAQIIKMAQLYALTAITYLYFTFLATPLTRTFTYLPFRGQYVKARRAIGVSAFMFGLLHASLAFFGSLGGFEGLPFLTGKYIFAISLSFTALVILTLMAITAFDSMIDKLGFQKWKLLHRFVYLAGILVVIHALLLGSHFTDLNALIPQIFFAALAILLILEAIRLDNYLKEKFPSLPNFGISLMLFLLILGAVTTWIYLPSSGGVVSPFNVHATHIQLAKEAQSNIPGLQGDKTKRFTTSFLHQDNIQPNIETPLTFQVYDASSGNKVSLFSRLYDKVMHLIIVDSELKYFSHIHPSLTSNGFTIANKFPHPGQYHLYTDFQPLGAIEQQFGFTVDVGKFENTVQPTFQPDTSLTKIFDKYEVTMEFPAPLQASKLSVGEQTLKFTIKDAATKEPITTLKPYLASFGHLVMIKQDTFDYLHVHPSIKATPAPDQNGGPDVEFLPLGLYGPIKPGIYRVFAQFNPDNQLFVSDFTIRVE